MKIRPVLLSYLLLVPLTLAREHSDVVVMQNGDRFTGEIKSLKGGVLKVDLDYVDGAVSVSWLKVARVESRQLFLVTTQDGFVHTGAIASAETSAGKPPSIQVTDGSKSSVSIQGTKVVSLDETSETLWRRFTGDFSLGAVHSKGNNATQYNLASEVEYRSQRWGAMTNFNSNLSASSGADTSTRNQVGLNAYRLMWRNNYFVSGFGNFLQSSVQGIDRQVNMGGGVGRFFKNTNRTRISLLAGLIWQHTDYRATLSGLEQQNAYGAVVSGQAKLFLFKKTNLSITGTTIPALSDRGRVYSSTNASYYLKFFGDFSWNFSLYGNWDTRPPPHFTGSDYGYSSGLTWTFNK